MHENEKVAAGCYRLDVVVVVVIFLEVSFARIAIVRHHCLVKSSQSAHATAPNMYSM